MRVAVWGAGAVGRQVAYRLTTASAVSELFWINRTRKTVCGYATDLSHGLAFAPSCHNVEAHREERAAAVLERSDLVVLTHGGGVPSGGDRATLYPQNASVLRDKAVAALRGFDGIVVVVTNPVDLLARMVHRETNIEHARVIGLGTLVETARARMAIAPYLTPSRPGRDLPVFGVGTHDEHFVLCAAADLGLGPEQEQILECARAEVVKGAARVKANVEATVHPIAEGVLAIVRAVALDSRALLTVSTLEPEDDDGLFLSVPCVVGSAGIVSRHPELIPLPSRGQLERCRAELRAVLAKSGELE